MKSKFKKGEIIEFSAITLYMQKIPKLFGGGNLKEEMTGMITKADPGFYVSYNIRLRSGKTLRHVPEKISGRLIMKKVS